LGSVSPITINHSLDKIDFNQSLKSDELFELTEYYDHGQIQNKYLLLKKSLLTESQLKSLKLDYFYEGNSYMIIEFAKYKRGVLFERMQLEQYNDLSKEDELNIEKINSIFKK
jgi:hypothetical protein